MTHRLPIRRRALKCIGCSLALALLTLGACRAPTKKAADREVYRILAAKRALVPELVGTLDIEAKRRLTKAARERTRYELTLDDAVSLAMLTSRDFQRQREDVYIAALDLTAVINDYCGVLTGGGLGELSFDEDGTTLDVDGDLTLSRAFKTGGLAIVGVTLDILRNLTGSPLTVAQHIITADIVLPLARGSGELVGREPLRQAERNVLYALRSYARFQQELRVDIASQFYRALQSRITWQNEELAYESLTLLIDEQNDKAKAGTIPKFEVDEAQQDLLDGDDDRQRARADFESALDSLKFSLGIPTTVEIVLRNDDLEALRASGPQPNPFPLEEALVLAARKRLDLMNDRDREQDAVRGIYVAADALGIQVDLLLGGSVSTPSEKPLDLASASANGSFGLDVDLPLNRIAERNAYRRAIIDARRSQRTRERTQDLVDLQVRDVYRNVEAARRSYEIQLQGVELAQKRVESTSLLLQRGDADIRARLFAEDSRVQARNRLIRGLVDYAIARLELERDVGTLAVVGVDRWTAADFADPPPPPAIEDDGPNAPGAPPAESSDLGDPPAAPERPNGDR